MRDQIVTKHDYNILLFNPLKMKVKSYNYTTVDFFVCVVVWHCLSKTCAEDECFLMEMSQFNARIELKQLRSL